MIVSKTFREHALSIFHYPSTDTQFSHKINIKQLIEE